MQIHFYKYQGTGNDFVMIDQRESQPLSRNNKYEINKICDRRFGIGADGLILLQKHATADFEMVYFNADGSESTMCGNGGRCIVAFANSLGITGASCVFQAIDGLHEAKITASEVELKMIDVKNVAQNLDFFLLDTGSPHYVRFVNDLKVINIFEEGRHTAHSDRFAADGVNVNFVEQVGVRKLRIATYERGVEAETLSCGTGVTAAAISFCLQQQLFDSQRIAFETKGGNLYVRLQRNDDIFTNIWLCGAAHRVFEGKIEL